MLCHGNGIYFGTNYYILNDFHSTTSIMFSLFTKDIAEISWWLLKEISENNI